MKAGWYERNGAAKDVLHVGEMPDPRPSSGEVRIRLHASGVNPSDVKSRRSRPLAGPRVIPHSDGAGIIDEVGEGVDRGRIGERVWTWNGQWRRPFGTAAQHIVLPAGQAVRLPDNVGYDAGACMGIPLLTAIHAVRLHGDIAGKALLVTGAASSVGHYVVQIAKAGGATVIGTASAARADHARAAGADHVIDYLREDVAARTLELTDGRGADGIVDMDLSSTAPLLAGGILAPHGLHACYGSNIAADIAMPFPALLWGSLTLKFFVVYELSDTERRDAIADLERLISGTALSHSIGARFGLDEIVAAHEAVESGKVTGNVVIEMD